MKPHLRNCDESEARALRGVSHHDQTDPPPQPSPLFHPGLSEAPTCHPERSEAPAEQVEGPLARRWHPGPQQPLSPQTPTSVLSRTSPHQVLATFLKIPAPLCHPERSEAPAEQVEGPLARRRHQRPRQPLSLQTPTSLLRRGSPHNQVLATFLYMPSAPKIVQLSPNPRAP